MPKNSIRINTGEPERRGRRKWANKRVPSKINPNYRRPLEVGVKGDCRETALHLGEVTDDMEPVFVEANGMRVYGVRKGDRRWVIGDKVQPAIDADWFIVIDPEAA